MAVILKMKVEIELVDYTGSKEEIANIILFSLRGIDATKKVTYNDGNFLFFNIKRTLKEESLINSKTS